MPKIAVEIKWDWPDEPFWLNADNVAIALHAHCKNTKFVVRDVEAYEIDVDEDFSFLTPIGESEPSDEIAKGKCLTGHMIKPRCVSCKHYEPVCEHILKKVQSLELQSQILSNYYQCQKCGEKFWGLVRLGLPERVVSEIHQAIGQASTC